MKYRSRDSAFLLLSDGTVFYGKKIGIAGTALGELCFNTGMTGYQEIFTDPSYYGQLLVATNAHIGIYGVQDAEMESPSVKISGLIVRNFSYDYSRQNATGSLLDFLSENKVVGISNVDTRALVSHIRDHGAMNGVITTDGAKLDALHEQLKTYPSMLGLELASKVSTQTAYEVGNSQAKYKIAVLDLGVKKSILRHFTKRDAVVKVFPYNTPLSELESWNPDGYFISNGPGDPDQLHEPIALAKEIIKQNYPLFGICLGHQVIGLAMGIPTYKMHNGHRGINHPVKNLISGKGEITSQNHGFAIRKDQAEAQAGVIVTHIHWNDQTIAGIQLKDKNCFSVQFHPEASPGPNDSTYLFDQFIENIKKNLNPGR